MKILVCIKQVPDMNSKFEIAANGLWYDTGDLAWRMNEYDEYAVEQAVRVKEQVKSADITVLSVGPERVKEIIKKALAIGCDRGVHIADDEAETRDSFTIAGIIAEYARDKDFDLIFTGMQSQDRGSAQVGVLVGEMLSMSSVTTVVNFSYSDNRIEVKRELEGGIKAKVVLTTPALVTCQLGLNTPRYPTFPNIMKAKKKELLTIPVSSLLTGEARQQTVRLYFPERQGKAVVLEGKSVAVAEELVQILKTKTSILD